MSAETTFSADGRKEIRSSPLRLLRNGGARRLGGTDWLALAQRLQ
jgi:hypothetical protein